MSPGNERDRGGPAGDLVGGRYLLEREVGRGGMGIVWLGRDEVLGRPVALKRIGLVPGAEATDLARAEREAQVSARLQHPNVVAVFDLVADGGDRWLAMEYVDGLTLADLVRQRGALPPDAAAALLLPVADALATAHAAGIVHRDVKPSNVLVSHDGIAKLSDFGIARRSGDSSLTQTGLLLGSPTYLAPEVASGERGGEPADVWSFGATLAYVLSGRPPYPADDNVLQTLHRIVREDPAPVPHAGWLASVLVGSLDKDPERRWTMPEVRDALAGTRPLSPLAPVPEVEPEPSRRRVPAEALLLGIAVVVVLAVALYAVIAGDDDPSQPIARSSSGPTTASPTSPSPSRTPSPTRPTSPKPRPTAAGMRSFIRLYVATVSTNPDRAWTMLTPAFQRASGGLERYRDFWGPARDGQVLDITADPKALRVSYHVHFDHFDNGPGPTILDLAFHDGSYRIAAEHTAGFTPAQGGGDGEGGE